MDNQARDALKEILSAEGVAVCRDPGRCDTLLRGRCGAQRKEILWLVGALHEGVVPELLGVKLGESVEGCVARLSSRIEAVLDISAEAATWAVESWALALGLGNGWSRSTEPTETSEREKQVRETCKDEAAPRIENDDLLDEDDSDHDDDLDFDEDEGEIERECPRPSCEFVEHVPHAGRVRCSACGHDYEIDKDGGITDPGPGVSEITCGNEACKGIFYWEMNEYNHDERGKECPYCGFWNRDDKETVCPGCEQEIEISDALDSTDRDATEATCPDPECGWRFEIYEDGTTGSLDYLIEWACPHCDVLNQSESTGKVDCRGCKRFLSIDRRGGFDPEIIEWDCEGCGHENKTQDQARGACSVCGKEVEFEDVGQEVEDDK